MPKARLVSSNGLLSLLSVFILSACEPAGQADTSDPLPTETTQGAELPASNAEPPATPASPDPAKTPGELTFPEPDPAAPAPPASEPSPPPPGTEPPATPAPAPPAPAPAPAPAPQPPAPAPAVMPYRGINLAGAEFGNALPGKEGTDYSFPTKAEVDYYMAKGMNTFRIGFKWERMQRVAYGAFDATYTSKLDAIISYAASKGATVILNPHNFARYYGNTVGSSQVPSAVFADFWKRLASRWVSDANVMFNLVNEPHGMPTEQWVNAANAAIAAIRETGAKNVIVVPGNSWTGAHSWASSFYGTPNSVALLKIVDPGKNVIFEAHQYMDSNSGGGSEQCVSTTIGSERLAPFIKWLRDHNLKGMIGEFAGGRNPNCYTAITNMLNTMMASSDVLVGWLWWAGGPGWGDYKFTLEPTGGKDQPQMGVLAPFLKD